MILSLVISKTNTVFQNPVYRKTLDTLSAAYRKTRPIMVAIFYCDVKHQYKQIESNIYVFEATFHESLDF